MGEARLPRPVFLQHKQSCPRFAIKVWPIFMAKSIKATPKKRGRPATGKDPTFALRLPPDLTARIDAFAKANGEGSRSEAMRELLERGLSASAPKRKRPTK
jgi:hypothetical protein